MKTFHVEITNDLHMALPVEVNGRLTHTLPKGIYSVRDGVNGNFVIAEGDFKNVGVESCNVRLPFEYVTGLETKLAEAGKELAEKNRHINEANTLLENITDTLQLIAKENEIFIDPAYPVTGLEVVRNKLNARERQGNHPVKVPADVAKALDHLYKNHIRDWVTGALLFYPYMNNDAVNATFDTQDVTHLNKIKMWEVGKGRISLDIISNGYEVEKTEREMKLDQIIEIIEENEDHSAAELIYKLFKGEQA